MPKVSVIIPAYNSAIYLPAAIESVLAQTYKDFEIIVIDDGSTDNTKKVVMPYLDRIMFLEGPNGGPAKARNRGIRKSSGEYVAFLDADDIWYPDKLDRQMSLFSKNRQYSLIHSDAFEIRTYSSQDGSTWFSKTKYIKAGWVFSDLLRECFILVPSVIVKRNCLEKVGLFDENLKCWEGYDLWLRIAYKHHIGFVDAPLYLRRLRENSTFFSSRLNEIFGLIKVMGKWENHSQGMSELDRETINMRLRYQYSRLGKYYLTHGCHGKARQAFKRSIARGAPAKNIAYFGLSLFPPLVTRTILMTQKLYKSATSRISNIHGR